MRLKKKKKSPFKNSSNKNCIAQKIYFVALPICQLQSILSYGNKLSFALVQFSFAWILSSCDPRHELAWLPTTWTLSGFLNHPFSIRPTPPLTPSVCSSPGAPMVPGYHSVHARDSWGTALSWASSCWSRYINLWMSDNLLSTRSPSKPQV